MTHGPTTVRTRRPGLATLQIVVLLALTEPASSQEPEWVELPNSPMVSRFNDASFVSARLGWIVNGGGEIYRTTDKGDTWNLMLSSPTTHFRSVGFVNDSTGFAGSVGLGEFGNTDPVVLRQTRDGGVSWNPVENFIGGDPVGLCGMQVINDSTVVSVGRVRGPAWFIKTTDAGQTWQTVNLDSLAAGLVDVRFFDPDTGYAVGLSNTDHEQSGGVILYTTDGGRSWVRRFATSRTGEWFWKVSFPTRDVGYVSLQRNSRTPIYFVKTTDGGATWDEKIFARDYYFVQGIGFVNERVGWIGGNSSFPTFETTDGGETWRSAGFGSRVNRFRFLGDSLAFAVGRRVYRLETGSAVGVDRDEMPEGVLASIGASNYPNPFTTSTSIRFSLDEPADVSIAVSDVLGRKVRTLLDHRAMGPGSHVITWDAEDDVGRPVSAGTYVYSIEIDTQRLSRPMILAE